MLQKKKKKKERKKKFPIVKRNRRSKKLAHRLVSIRKAQQEVCISHTSKKTMDTPAHLTFNIILTGIYMMYT